MSNEPATTSNEPQIATGLRVNNSEAFRFTIWDLLVLTTFVSLFFALPFRAQLGLMAAAIFVLVLCGPLLFVSWPTRVRNTAALNSIFLPFLLRATGYSLVVLLFAGIAAACRVWLS